MRDMHHNCKFSRGLSPTGVLTNANTAYVSEICDFAGFDANEFVILSGVNTDANATFTVLFEDGDAANLSDAAAVDDKYLLGTEAAASFTAAADDNTVKKIGYIGPKRYGRVTITPAGNDAGDALVAGVWCQGSARVAPQA